MYTNRKMPKFVDYSKGLIYKVVCKDTEINEFYIGSTTDFSQRKNHHKYSSINKDGYLYSFIREYGGWINFDMVLVEFFPCGSKLELDRRERHFIELMKPELNKNTPPSFGRCKHDLLRPECGECKGGNICKGIHICEHNRQRYECKDCNPILCKHCKKSYTKAYVHKHELRCKMRPTDEAI